jgi:hypothetical protein
VTRHQPHSCERAVAVPVCSYKRRSPTCTWPATALAIAINRGCAGSCTCRLWPQRVAAIRDLPSVHAGSALWIILWRGLWRAGTESWRVPWLEATDPHAGSGLTPGVRLLPPEAGRLASCPVALSPREPVLHTRLAFENAAKDHGRISQAPPSLMHPFPWCRPQRHIPQCARRPAALKSNRPTARHCAPSGDITSLSASLPDPFGILPRPDRATASCRRPTLHCISVVAPARPYWPAPLPLCPP